MKINNMRQIKFRAWDGYGKAWLNDNISIALSGQKYYNHRDNGTFEKIENALQDLANTVIVMQYTGLKDKNSKEIYEGDIVEWKYLKTWHKNEVRWVGGGFVITTSGFKDDLNEPQDLSLVSILNCEIIGNIYENPELLIH